MPLPPAAAIAKLYVAVDGTGIPAVPADTAGREGKDPDRRAHTREVKLGVVFTQTKLDEEGFPIRDPGSSSYVATLGPVEHFGTLIYAEARRRGSAKAKEVVVLGDGAAWIWNLAKAHFPTATHIVDLYHAKEHLGDLAKLLAPELGEERAGWLAERKDELDDGDIPAILAAARALDVPANKTKDLDTALGYFQNNASRMGYKAFRAAGHFVGSGTVEAGCKAVVAQRLIFSSPESVNFCPRRRQTVLVGYISASYRLPRAELSPPGDLPGLSCRAPRRTCLLERGGRRVRQGGARRPLLVRPPLRA